MTVEGRLILFTGLSGSGKTTLAAMLRDHLAEHGPRPVHLLDGDVVREFFEGDRGYSEAERHEVSQRMAFGAYTLVCSDHDVIVANIAARQQTRDFFRKKFQHYVEIFLDAPLECLQRHDPKGLYREAAGQDRPMVVGLDLPYEKPTDPDLHLVTHRETVCASFARLLAFLDAPCLGTKAGTLMALAPRVKCCQVPPMLVVRAGASDDDPSLPERVAAICGAGPVVVRSSACLEDREGHSMAGAFKTVTNVAVEARALSAALAEVRASYRRAGLDPAAEEVLIQTQLSEVFVSGVVFTRHIYANSPYVVISFDRTTGRTDTVTSGAGAETVFLSRFKKPEAFPDWAPLLRAVSEIESLFPHRALDIEFALTADGVVHILQCRPLQTVRATSASEEQVARGLLEARRRLRRLQQRRPHLLGASTILSNMADWNPAEIIGEKPGTLAYSLYRDLVCDETWLQARASQGYRDVYPAPLMVSLCRRAYIDTRASFNSLVPASVPDRLAEKLVDYYLDRIATDTRLHDKIEFEVAFANYSFQLNEALAGTALFDDGEIKTLLTCLRDHTGQLVRNGESAIQADLQMVSRLDTFRKTILGQIPDRPSYWHHLESANLLLRYTRHHGVLPFARVARLAFIARQLLRSLVQTGLLDGAFLQRFEHSLRTPAGDLANDLHALRGGNLELEPFLARYGHLRMNTYDIESPRYDQMPASHWQRGEMAEPVAAPEPGEPAQRARIDAFLAREGLGFDCEMLLRFARAAMEGRERAKFRFTRGLSDALEQIHLGTSCLGLSRAETQFLTLPALRKLANPEDTDPVAAEHYLRRRGGEKRTERAVHDLIVLPPVIATVGDIERVFYQESQPNYVTARRVFGPVFQLNRDTPVDAELSGKIVAIEHADPGYDWIFARGIAGLITKYGGAASHMAIRCAELDLPGAIGCGELLFERVRKAGAVVLDCNSRVVQTGEGPR